MQPETPPQTQPTAPYMQSMVHYSTGSAFNDIYGLLQWDQDNHIRMYAVDPATRQVKNLVIDCTPAQIQKARIAMSVMTIKIDGKNHNMDFSSSSLPWLAAGGLVGLAMSSKTANASGVQWWANSLRAHSVLVKQTSITKTFIIVFGVIFGLCALFLITSVVIQVALQFSQ